MTATRVPPPTAEHDVAYATTVRRLVEAMIQDLAATGELEAVAALLVHAGREMVPSAECVLTVVPPDDREVFRVVGGAGDLASTLVGTEWTASGTLNFQAMLEGRVVETTGARRISPALPPVFAEAGIDTARLLPLKTGSPLPDGRVETGVLSFWRQGAEPFSAEDKARMDDVADLASLFVRRAEIGAALARMAEAETMKLREHAERMAGLEGVKTQFLNLASHELRGPLALVQGYISMMEEGTLRGRQLRAVLPLVAGKLRQMNMLVNDMLETARLEDERLQLRLDNVDLGRIAVRVVENARAWASPAHSVEAQVPPGPVIVRADPTRLDTIVSNLVHNAIKYSPDGGPIVVEVSADMPLGRLTVTDTGLGIADEDLPRLFTRFGRLVTPDNSHIAGTGLGLYLSRQLATMHGGNITVASRAGRGSSFTLTIPLA